MPEILTSKEALFMAMPFKLGPLELILAVPLCLLGLGIYFLPTIIAVVRKHPNKLPIFLIDLFLGCTGLGWVGALVWSLINTSPKNTLDIAKERYAKGEITLAELEEIKKNIQ
jgi:uncharacterized membrane protein